MKVAKWGIRYILLYLTKVKQGRMNHYLHFIDKKKSRFQKERITWTVKSYCGGKGVLTKVF